MEPKICERGAYHRLDTEVGCMLGSVLGLCFGLLCSLILFLTRSSLALSSSGMQHAEE